MYKKIDSCAKDDIAELLLVSFFPLKIYQLSLIEIFSVTKDDGKDFFDAFFVYHSEN